MHRQWRFPSARESRGRRSRVGSRVGSRTGVLLATAALVLVAIVAITLDWWSPFGLAGEATSVVASAAGMGACLYAAARGAKEARRSWVLFASVLALYAGGDVLWLVYGGATGTPQLLSFADALYLLALVPAVAGLALYPAPRARPGTLGPLISDAAVLGAAALLVSYVLVFDEVVRLGEGRLDVLLLLVYPLTDVLLACMVVVLLLRSVGDARPDLVLIGLAFATYTLADNGYALLTIRGQDILHTLVDLGFTLAPLLLGLGAITSATRPVGARTMQRDLGGLTAPLLPDLSAIAALGFFVVFQHPDGTASWILAAITLTLTGARQLSLTADRQRVRHDLERRITTGNEDFRRLTEAHKRLESMKYEFVSAVSHELRTPLSAIHGALEVLADGDAGPLPARAQEVVELANRGTRRLNRLVDDIIDLERLERGTFSFNPRPEPLAPLLADAVAPLTALARERGIDLALGQVTESAYCDGDRVIQAVVNLVGNALKFTPAGGAITVATTMLDEGVKITVADGGRGIPPDKLASIFERFHQVHSGDDREYAGAGLGLTITKHLVEAQGGRIWVESIIGTGSTFCFTLPHAPARALEVAPEAAPQPRGTVPEADAPGAAQHPMDQAAPRAG